MPQACAKRLLLAVALCALGAAQLQGQTAGVGELNPSGAIWGIESSYGAVLEDAGIVRPVIRSLTTLTCGDEGRAGFWRDELLAAFQILDQGNVTAERMTGSWAGAMGHTQFMPTTYQRHAVDFDGDGKRDIWRSIPDALASTALLRRATSSLRNARPKLSPVLSMKPTLTRLFCAAA